MNILIGNIMLRKDLKYLHPTTEAEINRLRGTGDYETEEIEDVFTRFFGELIEMNFQTYSRLSDNLRGLFLDFSEDAYGYIQEWAGELETFKDFAWVALQEYPDWPTVKKTMEIISEKASFDLVAHSSAVVDQYGYMKSFCTNEKLEEWNNNKLRTDERWVEMFKHMETNRIPFEEFSKLIEFVLCFPGSSAPVERVFAKAKKIWKQDSSSLEISTLDSILHVKINMDWSCTEFHKFLKTQPELLRQISSQQKYDFKQPKPVEAISPGAMSIEQDAEEEE